MAKIILPSIFDNFSGTVKDVRYYIRNGYHCAASYTPYKRINNSIKQKNQQKAFSIIISDYNYLKNNYPNEYKSWLEESKVLEFKLQRTVTIVQLYTAFFLTKYQSELGQDVEPIILTGKGGFGSCKYGVGNYGVVTNCNYYHYKDRFLRRWLG